jgi:hypothetical protein
MPLPKDVESLYLNFPKKSTRGEFTCRWVGPNLIEYLEPTCCDVQGVRFRDIYEVEARGREYIVGRRVRKGSFRGNSFFIPGVLGESEEFHAFLSRVVPSEGTWTIIMQGLLVFHFRDEKDDPTKVILAWIDRWRSSHGNMETVRPDS